MTAGGNNNGVSFPDLPPQSPAENISSHRNRKRPLTRLVSRDELRFDSKKKMLSGAKGPLKPSAEMLTRRVSELEEAMKNSISASSIDITNPLRNASRLKAHLWALRLEADLFPMRLILTRLMSNPTHNKKGLFNNPVDTIALGLADYHLFVTKPMDLGTVKTRLHGLAYRSREQVEDEIRLVFTNAMRFNPSQHIVHKCARELLIVFEEYMQSLAPCALGAQALPVAHAAPLSRAMMTTKDDKQSSSTAVFSPFTQPLASSAVLTRASASALPQQIAMICDSSQDQQDNKNLPQAAPAIASTTSIPVHTNPGAVANSLSTLIPTTLPQNRRRSISVPLPHSCSSCKGRSCQMCKQGCLKYEPCLLVCHGRNCNGSKIRKGSVYYTSDDGGKQYCERCYASLQPVLSQPSGGDAPLYKKDLLRRKNNEEIVEDWLTCSKCNEGVHVVCAMHNSSVDPESEYVCPSCQIPECPEVTNVAEEKEGQEERFTFLSGSAEPVSMSVVGSGNVNLSSESLEECSISSFIQQKVRKCMSAIPNADKTVNVRVISDCSRFFSVPDVIRRHFRMATESNGFVKPPSKVSYRQKAIALFQKIDGLDVCVFCMYVQEYDGNDVYDRHEIGTIKARHGKRVYIAYIDSVEYFRPRQCRTQVYHEILVSYLATARERGYKMAQIWACPPSRGNSFVFWNHPASQRTPTRERLISWYHDALSHSIDCGIVTDIKSLFESDFEQSLLEMNNDDGSSNKISLCPPLLEGDYWVEEAVRLHGVNILRNLKIRSPSEVCVWRVTPLSSEDLDPCPAMQVAALVKDRIMTHPSSVPFRRPVNAAAMKLKDYHKIITEPMDLGTIYSCCVVGEYQSLQEVIDDMRLMLANARKFNPIGHFVYEKGGEVLDLFFQELASLVKIWSKIHAKENETWESYADLSMSLDFLLDMPKSSGNKSKSVVIEDDRSADGSRSTASSLSGIVQSSPPQTVKEVEMAPPTIQTAPASAPSKIVPRSSGRGRKKKPIKILNLLQDGSEAIMQRMVGKDLWLVDKRIPAPSKIGGAKKTRKRRRNSIDSMDELDATPKKRRQSWLGKEVAESVRKIRTALFTLSLMPKESMSEIEHSKLQSYQQYVGGFAFGSDSKLVKESPITKTRSGLVEMSQYRHFEFDTLRRAKYSTAMLIYHIRNSQAPGVFPVCTSCNEDIENVRWHKVKPTLPSQIYSSKAPPKIMPKLKSTNWICEEVCDDCYRAEGRKEAFIPIPVSLRKAH
jgi:hypothetical protein